MTTWNKLLRTISPAEIGAYMLIAASAALGAYYGFTMGAHHHVLVGALFAMAVVGGEVLKPIAVTQAADHMAGKRWISASVAATLATICIAYSMVAELGFVATMRGDVIAERAAVASVTSRAEDRRADLKAALNALPSEAQLLEYQKNIDAVLADKRAKGCQKIDGPFTTANCPRVAGWQAMLAKGIERQHVLAEITAIDRELSSGKAVGVADPTASSIAAYSASLGIGNFKPEQVSPWLAVLPVLLIEFGSAFGLLMARRSTPPVHTVPNPVPMGSATVPDVHGSTGDGPGGPPSAKILAFLKDNGGQFRGGQKALAERLGTSKTTVNRWLNDLREAGLLAVEEAKGSTTFRLSAA